MSESIGEPSKAGGGMPGLMRPLPLIVKPLLMAAAALLVGLPAFRPFDAFLLFTAAVSLWLSPLRRPQGRELVALAAIPLLLFLGSLVPELRIEERHSPFVLQTLEHNPFRYDLPADVYAMLEADFLQANPPQRGCTNEPGCWQGYEQNPQAWGFAADGFWGSPRHSRIVDDIDFSQLEGLRMAAADDQHYNFFRSVPGNIYRSQLPYFVGYTLPPGLTGSRLCWQGKLLWPEPVGYRAEVHDQPECRTITAEDTGREIFGVRILPNEHLSMHLHRPVWAITAELLRHLVIPLVTLALLLWATLQLPSPRRFAPYAASVGVTLLIVAMINHWALGGMLLFRDGNDGLTHTSFAYGILRDLSNGDVWHSLMGSEPVFYFMPALRYFMAVEKLIFGDSHWLTFMLLSLQPLVVYRLLRHILPMDWSAGLMVFYIAVPLFEHLGFAHFNYVRQGIDGVPESVGYFFLYTAILTCLDVRADPNEASCRSLISGLMWAMAVALRPNFALAGMLMLLVVYLPQLTKGRLRLCLLAALGVSPIFLVPLHNWVFGGVFVPLTSSATIQINMPMPPAQYYWALRELLAGNWHGTAVAMAVHQFGQWIAPNELYRLLPLAALLHAMISGRPILRILAWTGLALQVPLLFYANANRYGYGAWFVSFILFVSMFHDTYRPALLRRFPGLPALPRPRWLLTLWRRLNDHTPAGA